MRNGRDSYHSSSFSYFSFSSSLSTLQGESCLFIFVLRTYTCISILFLLSSFLRGFCLFIFLLHTVYIYFLFVCLFVSSRFSFLGRSFSLFLFLSKFVFSLPFIYIHVPPTFLTLSLPPSFPALSLPLVPLFLLFILFLTSPLLPPSPGTIYMYILIARHQAVPFMLHALAIISQPQFI